MKKLKPLVCIFAHPDDEAFGPGGSIAKYAAEREVYIICVTDGGTHHKFSGQSPNALSGVRKQELIKSSSILGIKDLFFLDYVDGSLNNNLYHEVAADVEAVLNKINPETLLTFDHSGISGHLDHIAVSLITAFLFERSRLYRKLLYYFEPYEFTKDIKDYFIYFPPGRPASEADLVEDVTDYWQTKTEAMYAHRSQIKDVESILSQHRQKPRHYEHFMVRKI